MFSVRSVIVFCFDIICICVLLIVLPCMHGEIKIFVLSGKTASATLCTRMANLTSKTLAGQFRAFSS